MARVAAACIIFILAGYNFDTMAFYGKRILGYENVMSGNLEDLNDMGRGQVIGKTYTFENGISITLDGIMIDESQLILFFTTKSPRGNVEEVMLGPAMEIKGMEGRYTQRSAQGIINKNGTQMKAIQSFEPPRFFEKTMHWKFQLWENGVCEDGEITFKIDRQKAMGHTLKTSIGESVDIESSSINFESILAAPTRTIVKGSIDSITEIVIDHIKNERVMPNGLDVDIIANGNNVNQQGSSMSTEIKGIHFQERYDALPENLESLELRVKGFSFDCQVNESIEISDETIGRKAMAGGRDIWINDIYESAGSTFVNITTGEDMALSRVYLMADGNRLDLKKTNEYETKEGEDGRVLKSRTLEFEGTGGSYNMEIKRMSISKECSYTIEIPVE